MKKNVLFLMYHLLDGGAEKSLINLLDYMDYSKYNVDLIVLAKEKAHLYDINKNVNVKYIYENGILLNQDNLAGKFKLEFDKEYDIEISYFGLLTTWSIAKYGNPNAKKIAWLHSDIRLTIGNSSKEQVNELFRYMDSIICVSQGAKQSFIEFAGNELEHKLKVILNPVDINQVQELASEVINYNKEKFTVLSIGRLDTGKGFERLIRIHKRLLDENIDHELLIIGSGSQEQILRNMITSFNLEGTCKILQYQKNPYPYIKMSDLFVSASYSEGLSLVIIESMILKKPIVATNTYGPRVLFKNNLGLMVENSEEELYIGIKNLIQNSKERNMYIDNLNNVKQFEFDKNIIMPQIEAILQEDKISKEINDQIDKICIESDIYFAQTDYKKAKEILFSSFEYCLPTAKVLYKIGFIYERERRYKESIWWYELIFSLGNITEEDKKEGYSTWKTHLELTVCYYMIEDMNKSLFHHKKAYEHNPTNQTILYNNKFFYHNKLL